MLKAVCLSYKKTKLPVDWGMSEEILSLPEIIDTLSVEVKISWEKQGTWIGIAEAAKLKNAPKKTVIMNVKEQCHVD